MSKTAGARVKQQFRTEPRGNFARGHDGRPRPHSLASFTAVQVRIASTFATITWQPWYEADLDLAAPTTLGLAQLRVLLASEPGLSHALRRMIIDIDTHVSRLAGCDEEELVQHLARLIERGLVRVVVEPRPLIHTQPSDDSVVPEHVVDALEPIDEAEHWIEVLLVGEDDEALSGVRCRIVLPNGNAIVRTTDRFGLVRIDGVEEMGECEISFPDLDSEAWEAI